MKSSITIVEDLIKTWSKQPNILVVDDEDNFCVLLKHTLEKRGCNVTIAENLAQLEQALAQKKTTLTSCS